MDSYLKKKIDSMSEAEKEQMGWYLRTATKDCFDQLDVREAVLELDSLILKSAGSIYDGNRAYKMLKFLVGEVSPSKAAELAKSFGCGSNMCKLLDENAKVFEMSLKMPEKCESIQSETAIWKITI